MNNLVPVSAKDLLDLVAASLDADYTQVRRACGRISTTVAETDIDVAKQLKSFVRRSGVPLRASGYSISLPVDPKSRSPLVDEQPWPVNPAFLEDDCQQVFATFVRDAKSIEKLQAHGLSGRMNLLLSGPPGTGKSLIAGHIAAQLGKPFFVIRLDSLVSSLLGDTAKNIRSAFEYVSQCGGVLFLDEFDAIAKLRDDKNELGELKRVVNTLLQSIDALDDKAILLAATNHANLLDSAVWRRFPYKMHLDKPGEDLRKELWAHFLNLDSNHINLTTPLAKISEGLSGADIEEISIAARRTAVLNNSEIDITALTLSIINIRSNYPTTSVPRSISASERKYAAIQLVKTYGVSQVEAAACLGVSRQTIATYLKE